MNCNSTNFGNMSKSWVLPLAVCAAAVVMCVSIFMTGRDGRNKADSTEPLRRSDIAMVNLTTAYNASSYPAALSQYRNTVTGDLIQQMNDVASAQYLSKVELSQFLQLITANSRTPLQDNQLAALKKANSDRSTELAALQSKPESALSPADTVELKQLEARSARLQQLLQSVDDKLQSDARDRIAAEETLLKQHVVTVAQAVAKAAGYHEVWSQENLIYCENDITPLVIKKLPH